jgi:ADP-ribosylglycohydrolase
MSLNLIHQVLQAFTIGDAAGMPTQMFSRARASEEIDVNGILFSAPSDNPVCPGLPGATVTDDTHQLLILADNLVAGGGDFNLKQFAIDMLKWEYAMISAGSLDLLGPSTKAALEKVSETNDPQEVCLPGSTNGAAMRVPAIACAFSVKTPKGLTDLIEKILQVNRVSHNSLDANLGSAAVAAMISSAIDGLDFEAALQTSIRASELMLERFNGKSEANYIARLPQIIEELEGLGDLKETEALLQYVDEQIGTSLESRESVLAAFAVASLSMPEPLTAAQNGAKLGGDSDTIGALASSMVAAFGTWGQTEQDVSKLVSSINDLDLFSRAVGLANLRNNHEHEL